ncbi:hypothetical protein ACRAQ7_07170 [Erythrobacter sp. W53]|uniref:hypothetical protein n=1 Tax=Erythrobacter sp. W53 TaxID=3425947 RepID=UPI003D7697DC
MSFLSRFNPAPALKDFWQEFRRPTEHRWPILAVSVMVPVGLLFILAQQRTYIEPVPPEVTYISTFAEGRTDAEIIASNIENQRIQDERAAEQERINEEVRNLYRELGRATGVDVDAIDERLAREAAEEEARQQTETENAASDSGTQP